MTLAAIRQADAAMANIADFRSAGEFDAGIVFETGYAIARSQPVFACRQGMPTLEERVRQGTDAAGRSICDNSVLPDDFG